MSSPSLFLCVWLVGDALIRHHRPNRVKSPWSWKCPHFGIKIGFRFLDQIRSACWGWEFSSCRDFFLHRAPDSGWRLVAAFAAALKCIAELFWIDLQHSLEIESHTAGGTEVRSLPQWIRFMREKRLRMFRRCQEEKPLNYVDVWPHSKMAAVAKTCRILSGCKTTWLQCLPCTCWTAGICSSCILLQYDGSH